MVSYASKIVGCLTNPENPDQISRAELCEHEVFLLRHPVCCILMNEIEKFLNKFVGKILA